MSRSITGDEDYEDLKIGRYIHEKSYPRQKKEILIGNSKFDLLSKKGGYLIVGEVKKSSKFVIASEYQLLDYLYGLKQAGYEAKGELLFPAEKKKLEIELTKEKEIELEKIIWEIEEIIKTENPPPPTKNKFCAKCSYSEFCWA